MSLAQLTVDAVMTRGVETIAEDAIVEAAAERMHALDIRHLPVVTAEGRVVGILSDRDVLRVMGRPNGRLLSVGRAMTADVLTVAPQTRAYEATAMMLDRKVGALPVVEPITHTLVGVVTETDFLRIAHRLLGGDRMASDDK